MGQKCPYFLRLCCFIWKFVKPVAFFLGKDFVSFSVGAEVLLCKVCLTWSVCIKKLQKASELSAEIEKMGMEERSGQLHLKAANDFCHFG